MKILLSPDGMKSTGKRDLHEDASQKSDTRHHSRYGNGWCGCRNRIMVSENE